jgi:methyl-accepting chemotaxis protein
MLKWILAQSGNLRANLKKPFPQKGQRAVIGRLSIRKKLPLLISAFSLASVVALMLATALLTRASLTENANQQISATVQERANQLSQWFDSTTGALLTMAAGKQTIDALYTLSSAYSDLNGEAKDILQGAYIAGNPNPVGERHLLDRAEGEEFYHAEHAKFHKTFRSMMEQNGLYDVFLINRKGDVVYTVFKETDFAENLLTGALVDSGLSDVYRRAMEAQPGEVMLSSFAPYAPSAGAFALFMATPVVSEMGVVVGVLAIQLPNKAINAIVKSDHAVGSSTETYLIDQDTLALSDSRFEGRFSAGETLEGGEHLTAAPQSGFASYENVTLQSGEIGIVATATLRAVNEQWIIVTERASSDIMAEVYALLRTQFFIGALSIAIIFSLSFWIARSITNPLGALNDSIQAVANGDYEKAIPNTDRTDEVGMMASSLDEMRRALQSAGQLEADRASLQKEQSIVVERLTEGLGNLASGDLSQPIDEAFPENYEILRGYYNQTVEKMGESIEMIAAATEGIRVQSHEITRAAEELAHRTEVQAATLEETAAAMDQMTASVKSAADGVQEVELIVGEARKQADQSDTVVKEAVAAMSEIEKSSAQISQIISVIDDIAFQTNLLALNAGVEAARAGDAGRGFAVVASEVGALAQRASTAAREIKTLISTSTHHVETGVERVKQAGTALQKIAQRVTHISSLTSTMATGASEQSIGLHEINVGVTQLDQATQKNAAMAEEANAASQIMADGMKELGDLIARFKLRNAVSNSIRQIVARETVLSDLAEETVQAQIETPNSLLPQEIRPPVEKIAVNARGIWQDF